jgi:predicted lipoprotein
MKKIPVKLIVLLAALIFLVIAGRYGFTVVKTEDAAKTAQSEVFDAPGYVESIWADKLLPSFDEKAIELSTLLSKYSIGADGTIDKESLISITKENGVITVGESHVYLVKGSGKIVAVNAESSMGTIEVALDGYSGPVKVMLYIGTRIPSDETSIRDGVGFISFGDFKEQTEYGKVASEINKKVLKSVLSTLDKNTLQGKTIKFKGAFNIRTFNLIQIELKEINVVPVEIELGA